MLATELKGWTWSAAELEKGPPGGSGRGKRARETRGERKNSKNS